MQGPGEFRQNVCSVKLIILLVLHFLSDNKNEEKENGMSVCQYVWTNVHADGGGTSQL